MYKLPKNCIHAFVIHLIQSEEVSLNIELNFNPTEEHADKTSR